MRSVHRLSPARVHAVLSGHDHAPRRHDLTRTGVALVVAVTISACTDRSIPTTPDQMSASAASAVATSSERATAPATIDWQRRGRGLVVRSRTNPINAARLYALLGVAQYGAAVAADRALGITGPDDAAIIGADDGGRAQYEIRRGAIGAASKTLLMHLAGEAFAANAAALLVAERSAMTSQLAAEGIGPNGRVHPQFTHGLAIGTVMGERMILWAGNDGWSAAFEGPPYELATPNEVWYQNLPLTTAPSGYQWPAMKRYFLTSAHQFAPPAPPAFGSAQFLEELALVHEFVVHRTSDQLTSAQFWNLNLGTVTAAGYWGERAEESIIAHGLGDRAASHVYALSSAAVMDATIGCWQAKYARLVMRPYHADVSLADPATRLPLGMPNHPSYPSGHSCVSAAAVTVISDFFPDRKVELEQGVRDAGMSRIYAGIHFPFDVAAGQALGRAVGAWALKYDRDNGLLTALEP
jgi:membrane-associated phospholipid phosphatase